MGWDNRKLVVNGRDEEMLKQALQIAFNQTHLNCEATKLVEGEGLHLQWHEVTGSAKLPVPLTAEAITPIIVEWLRLAFQDMDRWDVEDPYFDGSTSLGWEVSAPDRNLGSNDFYTICVIKPVILYHGK